MKKEAPQDILIALARLAPKVEPKIESNKKKKVSIFTSIDKFLTATGLAAGRNEVKTSDLYEAYELWAVSPMDAKQFDNKISSFIAKQPNLTRKVNMKPITLIEKIKEMRKNEQAQQQKTS